MSLIALVRMCSVVETIGAGLYVLLPLLAIFSLVHESRFVGYVEEKHPMLWHKMAPRGRSLLPGDGNYSYAGVQWALILCGGYSRIEDPVGRRLGRVAQAWSLAAIASLVVLGLVILSLQELPSLTCLVPSR